VAEEEAAAKTAIISTAVEIHTATGVQINRERIAAGIVHVECHHEVLNGGNPLPTL
jgi:hypothetical protein